MRITFSRWPWQHHASFMGRFGGGWNYKLGIAIGGSTVIIDLLFGSIRISFGAQQ